MRGSGTLRACFMNCKRCHHVSLFFLLLKMYLPGMGCSPHLVITRVHVDAQEVSSCHIMGLHGVQAFPKKSFDLGYAQT